MINKKSNSAILLLFLSIFQPTNTLVNYDTDSGRRFFIWSLSIGANNPPQCVETEFYNQMILASFEADCSDLIFKGKCRVVVDVDDGYTLIGITFKSETGIELITRNGQTILGNQQLQNFGSYGKVMNDLLVAFGRLWNSGMGAYMKSLWVEYCDLYISFSGFSLGACLAQMAAVRFKEEQWWPAEQMFYMGFGSPRCGNEDFAYFVGQSVDDAFDVIWFNDPFPNYPATTCSETASATVGGCTNDYFHCCTKIRYNSYSSAALNTYQTCDSSSCLPDVTTSVSADHWTYFMTKAEDVDDLTCTTTKMFP